jgi:hypothetical protein
MKQTKSKYKSSGEWKKADPSAYATARLMGLMDRICERFGWSPNRPTGYWTKERCLEDALKYKTRNDWQTSKKSGYHSAKRNGWRDECCQHMVAAIKPTGYWTKKRCLEEAKKYKTKKDWKLSCGSSFNAAYKNNWFEECIQHMENKYGSSKK